MRIAVLLVLVLAVAACGSPPSSVEDPHANHAALESVPDPVAGAPEATVTAVDIEFDPDRLRLEAGQPLNVTVVNEGEARHDFTVDAAGVHVNVEPGEAVTTSITLDEPGRYRAACTEPGHEDAGMVLDLEVT